MQTPPDIMQTKHNATNIRHTLHPTSTRSTVPLKILDECKHTILANPIIERTRVRFIGGHTRAIRSRSGKRRAHRRKPDAEQKNSIAESPSSSPARRIVVVVVVGGTPWTARVTPGPTVMVPSLPCVAQQSAKILDGFVLLVEILLCCEQRVREHLVLLQPLGLPFIRCSQGICEVRSRCNKFRLQILDLVPHRLQGALGIHMSL